jgi:WD40 repeat protein
MSRAIGEPSPDNRGEKDHIIRLWDSQTFKKIDEITGRKEISVDEDAISSAIIAPFTYNAEVEKMDDATDFKKNKTYIVLTPQDTLRLWNAHKKYHDRNAAYWPILHRQQISQAVAQNGKITATAKGKEIELDFGAKLQRERLIDHRSPIKLLQFSFDSKHLASLSWEGGVCLIWNVENVAPPY